MTGIRILHTLGLAFLCCAAGCASQTEGLSTYDGAAVVTSDSFPNYGDGTWSARFTAPDFSFRKLEDYHRARTGLEERFPNEEPLALELDVSSNTVIALTLNGCTLALDSAHASSEETEEGLVVRGQTHQSLVETPACIQRLRAPLVSPAVVSPGILGFAALGSAHRYVHFVQDRPLIRFRFEYLPELGEGSGAQVCIEHAHFSLVGQDALVTGGYADRAGDLVRTYLVDGDIKAPEETRKPEPELCIPLSKA